MYNPSEVNYNDILLDIHALTPKEKQLLEYLEAQLKETKAAVATMNDRFNDEVAAAVEEALAATR